MDEEKQVIILVGNVGAGKTTLCKKYVDQGYICISRDQLRYSIGSGKYIFNYDYEKAISQTELYMLKRFLTIGCNIIVDETNVSKKLRKRIIDVVKKYKNYKITAIELPRLSKAKSVNRRMKNSHGNTDKKVWMEVWEMFNSIYESPDMDEGIDIISKYGKRTKSL